MNAEMIYIYNYLNKNVFNNTNSKEKTTGILIYDLSDFYVFKEPLLTAVLSCGVEKNELTEYIISELLEISILDFIKNRSLEKLNDLIKTLISVIELKLENMSILIDIPYVLFKNLIIETLVELYNTVMLWLHKKSLDRVMPNKKISVDTINIYFKEVSSEMYIVFKVTERK